MDKVVSKIAALGVPGLMLLVAIEASGFTGAAAITTALCAIGPFGILGGIVTLAFVGLIVESIAEYGFGKILVEVIKELVKKGETKESILRKIDSYPISKSLKMKLKEVLEENWSDKLDQERLH